MTATDLARYRLTGDQFHGLGTGFGDAAALDILRSGQASKRRLLLSTTIAQASGTAGWRRWGLADAVTLLLAAVEGRPDIERLIFTHPLLDTWATRCLRQLDDAAPQEDGLPGLGYLAGLAAAAALRAGLDFTVTVPAPGGQVVLPTLGLAYGIGDGAALVSARAGLLTVAGTERTTSVPAPYTVDSPGWRAHREMVLDSPAGRLHLVVDDLDPYRICFGQGLAARLDAATAARLHALLAGAWSLIGAEHPGHALAMRTGLRCLVPLRAPQSGSVSSSARTAYGAIAASQPPDGAGMALLMIHEAQHMKLGALLDLVDLYDPEDSSVYHAPWRLDPRPVGALLQGVYAHVAVIDYWRKRRLVDRRAAEFESAYWLEQTWRAADTLAGCAALTPEGERFVGYLRATLEGWRREPTGRSVARATRDIARAVSVRWRMANFEPPPGEAARLARAWRLAQPSPPVAAPRPRLIEAGGAPLSGLARAIQGRCIQNPATGDSSPDAPTQSYLDGDIPAAAGGYAAAVTANPADDEAWIGLALATHHSGDPAVAVPLTWRPDLVRAVTAELHAAGLATSATAVAAWLSSSGALPPGAGTADLDRG
ncbi:MAG TPA: HEXXH motif domain-containing protein [Rugosimonospora sp.]|nr:HEXXH motif domain-containing protein [Rugosimonospora sp.]